MTKMVELRLRLSVERHCRDNVPLDDNIRPTAQVSQAGRSLWLLGVASSPCLVRLALGFFSFSVCMVIELGGVCLFTEEDLDHVGR